MSSCVCRGVSPSGEADRALIRRFKAVVSALARLHSQRRGGQKEYANLESLGGSAMLSIIDAKCYRSASLLLCVPSRCSDGTCPRGLATRFFLSFSVCALLTCPPNVVIFWIFHVVVARRFVFKLLFSFAVPSASICCGVVCVALSLGRVSCVLLL
jgi:hypothetical protein